MKFIYKDFLNFLTEKPSKEALSKKLFQLGHEHNLDGDVFDMGPEGGVNGGRIIAEGSPEKVSQNNDSYTGRFIKELLGGSNMKKTA